MELIDFFDDRQYLTAHPDLEKAFRDGRIDKAIRHYVLHGAAENRRACNDERLAAFLKARTLDQVPPERLIKRVHGAGVQSYAAAGKTIAFDLDVGMQSAGIYLPEGAEVLDFGCGPGRVAQWFQRINPATNVHGCDIDPEAIEWASANLPGIFVNNGFEPPLPYSEKKFDLIYSISVFSHLPEELQFRWLEELRRVTKPGGYLLLSVHGANLASRSHSLSADEKVLENTGFLYRQGNGVAGLPSFYQNTFHTVAYIHREWSKFFDVRFILKRGINTHQDLVICRVQ
jgi:SAM-dependent methyltransferase